MSRSFELSRVARAATQKLGIEGDFLGELQLSRGIFMVMSINDLVNENVAINANQNVSSGSATILTVPNGKRFHIINVFKGTSTGSNYIFATLRGTDCKVTGPASTGAQFQYTQDVVLNAGDTLKMAAGSGGDTSVQCEVMYWEEVVSITRPQ